MEIHLQILRLLPRRAGRETRVGSGEAGGHGPEYPVALKRARSPSGARGDYQRRVGLRVARGREGCRPPSSPTKHRLLSRPLPSSLYLCHPLFCLLSLLGQREVDPCLLWGEESRIPLEKLRRCALLPPLSPRFSV